jgi:hypothetical protein
MSDVYTDIISLTQRLSEVYIYKYITLERNGVASSVTAIGMVTPCSTLTFSYPHRGLQR